MMKKSLIIYILCCFLFVSFTVHPYHVGSVEINYGSKTKTFEITGRFFIDDLENALQKKYGKSVHFLDPKHKEEINKELENYALEYIKLKADNKFVKLNYLGYEEDKESVNIYLETESLPLPKKIEASVSMLYNLFEDQLNIIHIVVNGQRKSDKLSYPDRYIYQKF